MKIEADNFIKGLNESVTRLESGEELSGDTLASLVAAITSFEIEEGGPYALPGKEPDAEFNALIAYFLFLCEVELPKLDAFLEASNLTARGENFRKWQKRKDRQAKKSAMLAYTPDEQKMMDRILEIAEKRFANLSPELAGFAQQAIEKTIRGNRDHQMSLMSYYTKQALGKLCGNISDDLVVKMGLANIFFWTAFIIYDDFWDEDEAADPKILPVANLFARHYTDFFGSLLPESTGFRAFFHKLMDQLDDANSWETIYCRTEIRGSKFVIPELLPDYADYKLKYRPASGHILGPVAMLAQSGISLDSPEVKNLISYFKHYLIAMQINDDSHDWEEDMKRGHLSTVVVMLLEDLDWSGKEIDLQADLPELKKVFWFKTIKRAAEVAISHTERSRQALASLTILENTDPLLKFIDISENIAKKALKEQKDSIDFLKTYSK